MLPCRVGFGHSEMWNGVQICYKLCCNGDVWGLRECVIISCNCFVCLQNDRVCLGSWRCLMAKHYVSPVPGVLSDLY